MENVKEDNNKVNKNVNVGPQRRDVFNIKCITDKEKREVILNENKLKKVLVNIYNYIKFYILNIITFFFIIIIKYVFN